MVHGCTLYCCNSFILDRQRDDTCIWKDTGLGRAIMAVNLNDPEGSVPFCALHAEELKVRLRI